MRSNGEGWGSCQRQTSKDQLDNEAGNFSLILRPVELAGLREVVQKARCSPDQEFIVLTSRNTNPCHHQPVNKLRAQTQGCLEQEHVGDGDKAQMP